MQVDHACTLVLSVFIKMSPPYIGPCRPTWSVSALFRRYGFMMGQFRNVSWAGPTHTRFTESLVRLWRCESRSSPSWGSRDRGGGGRRGGIRDREAGDGARRRRAAACRCWRASMAAAAAAAATTTYGFCFSPKFQGISAPFYLSSPS